MDFPQLLLFASHFSAWFACVTKNTVSTTRGNEQKNPQKSHFPERGLRSNKNDRNSQDAFFSQFRHPFHNHRSAGGHLTTIINICCKLCVILDRKKYQCAKKIAFGHFEKGAQPFHGRACAACPATSITAYNQVSYYHYRCLSSEHATTCKKCKN